jgi:hypothetical protein
MTEYRYVGISDQVSLSKDDFARHDVDDQDAVTFNREGNMTAELSEKAATMLLAQGFPIMAEDEYQSFLERKRQELADEQTVDENTVTPPTPSAEELKAAAVKAIPPRPGSDADRDTLADYAWTHYSIPADTSEKKMTKAEINKALDEAEKAAERSTDES